MLLLQLRDRGPGRFIAAAVKGRALLRGQIAQRLTVGFDRGQVFCADGVVGQQVFVCDGKAGITLCAQPYGSGCGAVILGQACRFGFGFLGCAGGGFLSVPFMVWCRM